MLTEPENLILTTMEAVSAEHPEWERDDVIRESLQRTQTTKDDYTCLHDLHDVMMRANRAMVYSDALSRTFDDYSDLPVSYQIQLAVNEHLLKLMEDSDDTDINMEALLIQAYDIARRTHNTTSDYIVDDSRESRARRNLINKLRFQLQQARARLQIRENPVTAGETVSAGELQLMRAEVISLQEQLVEVLKKPTGVGTIPVVGSTASSPPITPTGNISGGVGISTAPIDTPSTFTRGRGRPAKPGVVGRPSRQIGMNVTGTIRADPTITQGGMPQVDPTGAGITQPALPGSAGMSPGVDPQFFRAMDPVTSSNVAEIGYDNEQLIVAFDNGGVYAYDVGPEFYEQMNQASSKGKFVWQKLRGWIKGHVIDNPSKETPGGVGGSLVPYHKIRGSRISKRAQKRVIEKFSQFKESVFTPLNVTGAGATMVARPTVSKRILNAFKKFKTKVKGFLGKFRHKADFVTYVSDFIIDDYTIMRGPITRGGDFEYREGTRTKDYNQLKEIFTRYAHAPAFDAHDENRMVGFTFDWEFDDTDKRIWAKTYTFDDIDDLTNLPPEERHHFPVSIRFTDNAPKGARYQDIGELLHLAISFNKTDRDRCSTAGGKPCYVSIINSPPEIAGDHLISNEIGAITSDFTENGENRMPDDKKDEKKDKDESEEKDDKKDGDDKKKDDMDDTTPPTPDPVPTPEVVTISKDDLQEMLNTVKSDFQKELTTIQEDFKKEAATQFETLRKDAETLAGNRALIQERVKLGQIKSDFDVNSKTNAELEFVLSLLPEKVDNPMTYPVTKTLVQQQKDDFEEAEKYNRWGTNKKLDAEGMYK